MKGKYIFNIKDNSDYNTSYFIACILKLCSFHEIIYMYAYLKHSPAIHFH